MAVYWTIESIFDYHLDPGARAVFHKLIADHDRALRCSAGASNNHHAWPGGYWDHVQEVMNLALVQYEVLCELRPLPFSLSDALIVLFVHDLEKPWKYVYGTDFPSKAARQKFRESLFRHYGLKLSPEQMNALLTVEGETEYSPSVRQMGELAAFCHVCDVLSARLWFDRPAATNEVWGERSLSGLML